MAETPPSVDPLDDPPAEVSDFPEASDPAPTPHDEDTEQQPLSDVELAELRAELGVE